MHQRIGMDHLQRRHKLLQLQGLLRLFSCEEPIGLPHQQRAKPFPARHKAVIHAIQNHLDIGHVLLLFQIFMKNGTDALRHLFRFFMQFCLKLLLFHRLRLRFVAVQLFQLAVCAKCQHLFFHTVNLVITGL